LSAGGAAAGKHVAFFGWRDLRDPRAGGAELYAHDLLKTLAQAGYRCTLFVSHAKGQPEREEREYYTVIRRGNRVTCRFHAAAWLARNSDDIDCVIDELSTLPFLSRLVARDKTIVLVHQLAREVWWYEAPLPVAVVGHALEPLMVQIYRNAPVITVSKSSAASLREMGLRGPIEIIENPLRPPVEAASAPVRGRIGYVGRLTPSKRVDHIVRAFAILAARRPNAELWVVGGGPERTLESLRALAQRLGCADRVRFTGFIPGTERDAMLASLDCLVMASAREGWGRVVSEAARYGVPSVGYDVYGLRDAIVDGKTGLLVREQRPEALASAIERLIDDPSLRNRLGSAAAEYLRGFTYGMFEERVRRYFARPHRSERAVLAGAR
jgi:glycosyltransferase involved in cell wall biosynthesis